jgi:hypothetical protein
MPLPQLSLFLATAPPGNQIYAALATLALAVLGLFIDMAAKWIGTYRENRKNAKQSSFVYLAEKQVLLDQVAERICLEAKAEHVSLYRLHNGEFFEGNDSIKKMSLVSEATKDHWGPRWKDRSQNLLLSNFPHLVLALDGPTQQPFYVITPENVLDFEFGRLLNERGLDCCLAMLIRGKKGRPVAMLFLSWRGQKVTLDTLDTNSLESNRRDLSFIISD